MKETILKRQIIPLGLTVITAFALTGALAVEIFVLNYFTPTDISLRINPIDVIVGLTIYLKTSIDFAIFIGHLIDKNPGWKSRVSVEIGTAIGNAAGTMAILLVWTFFKEVRWLLALMIFLAALVLFKLAEESLEHAQDEDKKYPVWFRGLVSALEKFLDLLNKLIFPVLKYIVPKVNIKGAENLRFWSLFAFSFTIPFILGLDDFAGYVPLFSIINVFGFAIGVFAGHMALNMLLYISPHHTIKVVKNPIISLAGSIAFVGLALWGLWEVIHLIGY